MCHGQTETDSPKYQAKGKTKNSAKGQNHKIGVVMISEGLETFNRIEKTVGYPDKSKSSSSSGEVHTTCKM